MKWARPTLAGGIFGVTSGKGVKTAFRPRLVGYMADRTRVTSGHKELILDQSVEMLLRVYHN